MGEASTCLIGLLVCISGPEPGKTVPKFPPGSHAVVVSVKDAFFCVDEVGRVVGDVAAVRHDAENLNSDNTDVAVAGILALCALAERSITATDG